MLFKEHNKRSFIKAVTYRTLILIADGVIIFAITRRYDITLGVMFFSNISSSIIYFLHERAWNKVRWGRI